MSDDTTQFIILFGSQFFGPFDSTDHAKKWMAQSDILDRLLRGDGSVHIYPLTKPEMDEEVRA